VGKQKKSGKKFFRRLALKFEPPTFILLPMPLFSCLGLLDAKGVEDGKGEGAFSVDLNNDLRESRNYASMI